MRSTDLQRANVTDVDGLRVEVHPDRQQTGSAAAASVASHLRSAQRNGRHARVVFASAPSQDAMLAALVRSPSIDWSRVTVFHMDEFLSLAADDPRSFAHDIAARVGVAVPKENLHLIDGRADPETEGPRYTELLTQSSIDVCCLGIGENGHLAFNDPPSVDFDDHAVMRVVELTETSRQQQVHDRRWPDLAAVPRQALTMTVPGLLSARHIVGTVVGQRKRRAVHASLFGPIEPDCPASALRTHDDARLFVDVDAWQEGDR